MFEKKNNFNRNIALFSLNLLYILKNYFTKFETVTVSIPFIFFENKFFEYLNSYIYNFILETNGGVNQQGNKNN